LWEAAPSEFAALHRELELIRRWRPRCNVQGQPLRRQFTHVCIGRPPAPYVFLSRKPPANASVWFGPIPLGHRAREAVRRLNDLFHLRDCPQAQEMIFSEQANLFGEALTFGCLRYELGTCLGPCAAACSRKQYSRSVRQVRAFLTGEDAAPLQELERLMADAAAAQQFERAASLRDRIQPLRWLGFKLEQMRRARAEGSFIYPVRGLDGQEYWYLIHGGRTIAAVLAPANATAARLAARAIQTIYRKDPGSVLSAYEHADGLMLVAAWFRRHGQERAKTIMPAEALARCRMT
jgi:excinuclease ABC subunit C